MPERFSQTLLGHADKCRRSAYLYLKHQGGGSRHELDLGTAFHAFAERATNVLIEHGEPALDPDTGKVLMREVLDENPQLTVTCNGKVSEDKLGEMVYHWCVGFPLNVASIVAVERKFVMELGGRWVSGKVDVASIAQDVGRVRDYKTTFNLPSQEEFEESWQTAFYGVLLVYGRPVEGEYVDAAGIRNEVLGEPLGDRLQWIDIGETFPRYLDKEGRLVERHHTLSRLELDNFRDRAARLVEQFSAQLETWKLPAVSGSHCQRCPCEPECPLPRELRRFAGAVNSREEAEEAAEWAVRMGDRVSAAKKELREWAKLHGTPLRAGRDQAFDFGYVESREVDWEALQDGIERSVRFGEAFDLSLYRKTRKSSPFNVRKLSAEEIGEIGAEARELTDEERFGAEAPF